MTAATEALPVDATTRLVEALDTERRLLDGLCDALAQQRSGIAADDSAAIESANQGVARAILTLDEARRRREQLVQVTPQPHLRLQDASIVAGPAVPDDVAAARERLRITARRTVQMLQLNQTILRNALRAGDRYVQALFASASEPLPTYRDSHALPLPAPRGVVVNRSA